MIGIQLYTVRTLLDGDFRGTLEQLAAIGFTGVEFAWNYGGMAPTELRDFLDGAGLACLGVYAPGEQILDPDSDAYRYAVGLDSPHLTTGLCNQVTAAAWPGAIATVARAAEVAADRGIRLLYHNHWQELVEVDGEIALDRLFAATDPALVGAELDVAWLLKGGVDPAAYVRRYGERSALLHMKDIHRDGPVTEIGAGDVDFPAVLAAARAAGIEHYVYEQDDSVPGPLASAAVSYGRLHQLLEG